MCWQDPLMLKRVRTDELELGMFIHRLEGSWFKHPFWKGRFLLTSADRLERLLASEVETVIIDTDRGLGLRARARGSAAPYPSGRQGAPPPRAAPLPLRSAPHGPVSTAQEFGTAQRGIARVGKVVSRVFLEARLGRAIGASAVEPVIEEIYASIQRNLYAFNGLLRCQQDSAYVYRHSLAVSALMIALARQMKLSPVDMREAGMAGLLMDIGVGQLSADLLATDGDYRSLAPDLLHQHVVLGHALLKAAGDMPDRVLNATLRHHERLDGTGYPHGLRAAGIDLFSRMGAVCDTYDNLVAGGGGKAPLDPAEAIRALEGMVGAIDGDVLNAFIATVGVYPIGSLVRLRSERLAMVIDEDPDDSALPTVRTFWSLIEGRRLRGETIALARCYGEDEIVGIADLSGLCAPNVEDLRAAILATATREAMR